MLHTCYKMFSKKIFKEIELKEYDFSFCPEITTKVSNLGIPIYEVPISYKGRTYEDGKKISFKDGFKALYTIIKYSKKIKKNEKKNCLDIWSYRSRWSISL